MMVIAEGSFMVRRECAAQVMADDPGRFPQKTIMALWNEALGHSEYELRDAVASDRIMDTTPMSKCPGVRRD